MNQPTPPTPPPSPPSAAGTPSAPSWFAWISLVILGLLNAVGTSIAVPTLLMVLFLASNSDKGGISVMGLPEFFYVPAQAVLFLPSLVIVLVAAARKNFNLPNKLHLGVLALSGLNLLLDIVGLVVMLVVIMW